jgi:23S rRNA A1618 N6-methylase RlmF
VTSIFLQSPLILISRALTQVLLLNDFGLRVILPPDRLCPPLPNRINYLCWLSELLDFQLDYQLPDQSIWKTIPLLDIGVGASCIYPLLGNKLFHWNFVGSDIDHDSLRWAQQLILSNDMQDCIRLSGVDSSAPLQTILASLPLPNIQTNESDSSRSFLQVRIILSKVKFSCSQLESYLDIEDLFVSF